MKLKFTQIPYNVSAFPKQYQSFITEMFTHIVNKAIESNLVTEYRNQKSVIGHLNYWAAKIVQQDTIPDISTIEINPNGIDYDNFWIEDVLKSAVIAYSNVEWDINDEEVKPTKTNGVLKSTNITIDDKPKSKRTVKSKKEEIEKAMDAEFAEKPTFNQQKFPPTPKEYLYLKPMGIPRFDKTKPWMSGVVDDTLLCIYTSLPLIPTKQCEISCTTDINMLSDSDFLSLYPNCVINTRYAPLYEQVSDIYREELGSIFHIDGFTERQLVDNIIKYPHFYKLKRFINDEYIPFYNYIEIDGELHETSKVWDEIPDTKHIPRLTEYAKDYVIRRYLLERDVKKIQHKYPMFGELQPHITLFMPPDLYKKYGFKNPLETAKQCVNSRVAFYRSRNPIIRRLKKHA